MSINIQTTAVPMAFCGQPYHFAMKAEAVPEREIYWRNNEDTPLPWGLQINGAGQISGIPTTVQQVSVQFYAEVRDPDESGSCILNMKVYKRLAILSEKCWQVSLTDFKDIVLSAEGGVWPYQWTCDSLPIGLRLDGNVITGRPQASGGITPVRVKVKDYAGNTAEGSYQLKITY